MKVGKMMSDYDYPTPKYAIGDQVKFEVEATIKGFKLSQSFDFVIVGIKLSSDSEKRLIVYDLSTDPTAAYHGGQVDFVNIEEKLLTPK
jgi:hypothetical protein